MALRATHITTYMYSEASSLCQTEVHLKPRSHPRQALLDHELLISPLPEFTESRLDYFGNEVTSFSINESHETLTVTSRSLVKLTPAEPLDSGVSTDWEQVRGYVKLREMPDAFDASQFVFDSPLIQSSAEMADYALPSFPSGRPVLDGVHDLSRRIHRDFKYDQRATNVSTSVAEVLKERRGVCQDFAHLMIACMRSLGLPARYISGYLKSSETSVGAEASHAWVSAYCPIFGWWDFDPTNNARPSTDHVTIAWGRDYSDVTPVRGVSIGGGSQVISVSVEVVPNSGL
ncbi:MAG: transglutaminase family protein [Acidobacteria bacterium]|nr:transglutaminase family protein [Acidobacteriota bacterium]